MPLKLNINQQTYELDADDDMPLLWVIRDFAKLTGTKFGCGIAQCGSCTVLLDNAPIKSCVLPASAAVGKQITTIEGISENNDHPVQQAWIEEQVPQCGYCQSGQILTAVALIEGNPQPSDEEIETAMNAVLCRCGTYPRIKKAITKMTRK
ncbi:MAG: (2Fe-2S)-binding protein [Bacteroidota bacterium]